MKGPGLRVDLDVRRTWRCPRCSRERRAAADVTSLACSCAPDNPRMQLVESKRCVRPEPKPLDLVLDIDLETPDPDFNETASDGAPIESGPVHVPADASGPNPDRRAQRRTKDRDGVPSIQAHPPGADVVSEAAGDTAGSESAAVGQSAGEGASADDPDDFGAGLADAPSPPVPGIFGIITDADA